MLHGHSEAQHIYGQLTQGLTGNMWRDTGGDFDQYQPSPSFVVISQFTALHADSRLTDTTVASLN